MARDHRGRKNPHARLTEQEVAEIRLLRRMGATLRRLSSSFGVSLSHVWRIVTGRAWS